MANVYFILDHASGLIKIGRCRGSVTARLRSGQSFNPNPMTILGWYSSGPLEKELHRIFARDRVVREWFKDSPGLRDVIKVACAGSPTGNSESLRARCRVCFYQAVKGSNLCRQHAEAA